MKIFSDTRTGKRPRARRIGVAAALMTLFGAGAAPVFAADILPLLAAKRCNACHDMSATLIGPSYSAIAVRHRSNKETLVEVLARKIVLGGGGNWGAVPMVPNEHVSIDEARVMARWILEIQAQ
jgi:cytochrome c551/c552